MYSVLLILRNYRIIVIIKNRFGMINNDVLFALQIFQNNITGQP